MAASDATLTLDTAQTVDSARAELLVHTLVEARLRPSSALSPAMVALLDQTKCGCDTCEDALSPMAYLADLLSYTVRHVRRAGSAMSLVELQARFHQPFADLPVACSQLSKLVPHARIGVEILREHLNDYNELPSFAADAYLRLLNAIGTSYDELRAVMRGLGSASDLARRLMLADVNILREIFFDPNAPSSDPLALLEGHLMQIFGLRSSTESALAMDNEQPRLLIWRREFLENQWHEEDASAANLRPLGSIPIVDPDLVQLADVDLGKSLAHPDRNLVPKSEWSAVDFIEARSGTLNNIFADVQQRISGPAAQWFAQITTLLDDLQNPITFGTGATGFEGITASQLLLWRKIREGGGDISAELSKANLTVSELDALSIVISLARGSAPILTDEWRMFYEVMIDRIKRFALYPSWLYEEQSALTLTPVYFVERSNAARPWIAGAFRANAVARQRWVDLLRMRSERWNGLPAAIRSAVEDVERVQLIELRNALLRQAALPGLLTPAKLKEFTDTYQFDFETSVDYRTTRVAQATHTLQGILFGIRSGLIDDLTLALEADQFDREMRWLGSYVDWLAAMQVFLYPENGLRPTLRREATPGFEAWMERVRELDGATGASWQSALEIYADYFRDVSQLRTEGMRLTQGLLPAEARSTAIELDKAMSDVVAIARAETSGRHYYSVWELQSGYGLSGSPDQTYWRAIANLPSSAELLGLLSLRKPSGEPGVGMYFRERVAGKFAYHYAVWSPGQLARAQEAVAPAGLLCASVNTSGVIEAGPGRAPRPAAWSCDVDDRYCAADLDGNGRDELLVFAGQASTGMRRVGVCRELCAALVLDAAAELPSGWRLPDPATPRRLRRATAQGVLVVNDDLNQIGALALVNGVPTIVGAIAIGSLLGANFAQITSVVGVAMRFFDLGDPSLILVAAYAVGDDPVDALPRRGLSPVGTWLAALGFGQDQFTLRQAPIEMKLLHSADASGLSPLFNSFSVRCERFVPLTKFYSAASTSPSVTHDLVFHLSRIELHRDASGTLVHEVIETHHYVGVVAWKDPGFSVITGSAPHLLVSDRIAASQTESEWGLGDGDRFVGLRSRQSAVQGRLHGDLIVHNAAAASLATLASTSTGMVVVTKLTEQIEPEFPEGEAWELGPADSLLTFAPTTSPLQRLYVVNAPEGRMAELTIDDTGTPKVRERWNRRVPFADAIDIAGWSFGATPRFVSANLDGDGTTELIATSVSAGIPSLGVLKALPAPIANYVSSVPARFGPEGVTVMDLTARANAKVPQRAEAIAEAYRRNLGPGKELNLIYLDEAYYFVPMEHAIRLRLSGRFIEALDVLRTLYDYAAPINRRSSFRLVLDQGAPNFVRDPKWLLDPLDPHAIALVRKGSYTRFTLLTIISCLIEFADAAFTEGTAESIPRARELYLRALDLFDTPELKLAVDGCEALIGQLTLTLEDDETLSVFRELARALQQSALSRAELELALGQLEPILRSELTAGAKLRQGREALEAAGFVRKPQRTLAEKLELGEKLAHEAQRELFTEPVLARELSAVALAAVDGQARNVLRNALALRSAGAGPTLPGARVREFAPAPSLVFCIAPNPVIAGLHARAELALRELRSGRNIAGLQVNIEPYPIPTALTAQAQFGAGDNLPTAAARSFKPLPYRYNVVVERAKQLIELARQMEASMLNYLEAADQRRYEELNARQDLALARSAAYLKELQVNEAVDQTGLALLQRDRTRVHRAHLNDLIGEGTSALEELSLAAQVTATSLFTTSASASVAAAATDWMHLDFVGAGSTAEAFSSSAQAANSLSGLLSTSAGYERRTQEWRHERALADEDLAIGAQQIRLTQDHAAIATREQSIARAQVDHAERMLDFLLGKRFANADLFEWMSGVLQGIYRYFLSQATAMAKQAEVQLAFERQEALGRFIKDDYSQRPERALSPDFSTSSKDDNVFGLTGSARLLRDLWQLDQYAFKKNERKLQLVETISLAQLDPFAFQRFRQNGILYFTTPSSYFDRKLPGHYLRLIKRVRVSVVALVPPGNGIKAMLSTVGSSRVVIGGDTFQHVTVQRGPETIALSSPQNSTGTFELDAQPELLAPFEGIGVDAAWAFEMAKAANLFDYDSIADLQLTIEYTALYSARYREQVLAETDGRFLAERAYSFRNDFNDAWYELHNPSDPNATTPLSVQFEIRRQDFPANLASIALTELVLYFAPSDGQSITVAIESFVFTPADSRPLVPAQASDSKLTSGEVISTRRGLWNFFKGAGEPFGSWNLQLAGSMKAVFKQARVKEILLVLSYRAQLPSWPS